MSKYKLKKLTSRQEKLEAKLLFNKTYLPISIQEKEAKLESKLTSATYQFEQSLKTYAIEAGIHLASVDEEKANKIKKLEKKYNLRFRALKQQRKRALLSC